MSKNAYKCKQYDVPPMPKLEKPALFMGAHGELFNYVTMEKDGLVFTMAEVNIPPGKGPPAHIHHHVSEYFYAPEGGITIFASDQEHMDQKDPPSREKGTQVSVYLIPLEPKQVFCCTKHRVHGYVNHDKVDRSLICFWKPYPDAPEFRPYNDGGTREFFEAVHHRVVDPNDKSSITEKRRNHYIGESPKYAVPHSAYLLQFINRVDPNIPETLNAFRHEKELEEMLALIREYHNGGKNIICH